MFELTASFDAKRVACVDDTKFDNNNTFHTDT